MNDQGPIRIIKYWSTFIGALGGQKYGVGCLSILCYDKWMNSQSIYKKQQPKNTFILFNFHSSNVQ